MGQNTNLLKNMHIYYTISVRHLFGLPGKTARRKAVRFGWIADPEFWSVVLDTRNGSVHDYFGMPMDDYLTLITQFADEVTRAAIQLAALTSKR